MKLIKQVIVVLNLASWALGTESCDNSVAIVAFQPKTRANFSFWTGDKPANLTRTRDFTVCFRYRTRYVSDVAYILETNQIKLSVYKKFGAVFLRPWNALTSNEEYRRVFLFCKTYEPGHWVSVCLRVKLEGNTQEVYFFQDGDLCFKQQFLDGTFEWMYFKDHLSLSDLLR